MILDTLDNLQNYVSLNPLFEKAFDYLLHTNLYELPAGKIVLQEDDIIVNVNEIAPKSQEEALLETHKQFIDIQLPLSNIEKMGYTPAQELPYADYDERKDIAFYPGESNSYFSVKPGMFTIFFPEDGHAPGITPTGLKKIIVKVRKQC